MHGFLVERAHIPSGTILQVKLNGVTHTVTRNHTWLEAEYLRLFDLSELCIQSGDYGIGNMFAAFTLTPVFQTDDSHTVRCTLTSQETVTGYSGVVFYFRGVFEDVFYLVQHLGRLCQRTTRSNRHVGHDSSLVFLRNKTCFGTADQPS